MPAVHLKLDTSVELPGEAPLQIGASVWWPEQAAQADTLLLCLPGGNMNRRYFDLRPPSPDDGDDSFSFAAQMTARGFVVAALDHLLYHPCVQCRLECALHYAYPQKEAYSPQAAPAYGLNSGLNV